MSSAQAVRLELYAVPDFPLVRAGDDLAVLIADSLRRAKYQPQVGDVVVVAQKIVSKAEDRFVVLGDVAPSPRARRLAEETGKDPALVEVILSESREVLRWRRDLLIVEHRLGFVMANAGVDMSNVGAQPQDQVLMLPVDPDASCHVLREGLERRFELPLAVLMIDTTGRAWRNGVVGIAIGAAGFPVIEDCRGRHDLFGRALRTTEIATADQLASAASLLMGQADEGRPVVVARGLAWSGPERPARDLVRNPALDLFR